jgi:hypothetical protein
MSNIILFFQFNFFFVNINLQFYINNVWTYICLFYFMAGYKKKWNEINKQTTNYIYIIG